MLSKIIFLITSNTIKLYKFIVNCISIFIQSSTYLADRRCLHEHTHLCVEVFNLCACVKIDSVEENVCVRKYNKMC